MAINTVRTAAREAFNDAQRMMDEVGAACVLKRQDSEQLPVFAARPAADLWDGDEPEGWGVILTLVPGLANDPRQTARSRLAALVADHGPVTVANMLADALAEDATARGDAALEQVARDLRAGALAALAANL